MTDVAKRAQGNAVPLGADSRHGAAVDTQPSHTSASKTIMALQLLLVAVLGVAAFDTRGESRGLSVSLNECTHHRRLRADVTLLHPIQIRLESDGGAVALSKELLRERYTLASRDAAARFAVGSRKQRR